MHRASFREMRKHLGQLLPSDKPLMVLDVGSGRVGDARTYRELMSPSWIYTGCDICAGPNVDVVMPSEDRIPSEDNYYDVVLSGQCFEHVRRPWILIKEMARVLKVGGIILVTAPFMWKIHCYPIDCWRFAPDGMKVLFEEAGLKCTQAYINLESHKMTEKDCWAIGIKE